ncbi:MAG: CBS domain-containing protein [Rhodobacteraceae bacterium]|nr:MAG: CBS domain-containing protein [Paracoccaceae bacterium]
MTWSFPIGRLAGSELRVHVTFFLLLAWVFYAAYAAGGLEAALGNLAFVLALFACVVAHEFGHALAARRYGIGTPDITLLPIGGLARLDRMPEDPRQEIVVALAGPMVNVVIFAGLILLLDVLPGPDAFSRIGTGEIGFAEQLAAANLFLVVFNMIPAFPMDGGRVLRAALSMRMDRVRATRAAARAGQAVALVFGFLGLSGGNPMLVLIALFVFVAAAAEAQDVAMRALARGLMARDAMITEFEALSPDDGIEAAASALIRTTQAEFPVIGADGALAGFVTRHAIFAAHAQGRAAMRVAEIADTDIPRVALAAGLEKVLEGLGAGRPAVAVVTRDDRLLGYVTRENIGELMVLKGR